jgi:hypothetical protein
VAGGEGRSHLLRPMPILPFRTIILLAALAAACSEELPPPEPDRATIDAGTFTRAVSDLVVARIEILPDTVAYRARAAEILGTYGVSEADMRTFVQVHGQNDDLMTRAYGRVEARLDSLYPTGQAVTGIDSLIGSTVPGDSAIPAP